VWGLLHPALGAILLPQYRGAFATVGHFSMTGLAFPIWRVIKGIKEL
jgi:hypothetical protein